MIQLLYTNAINSGDAQPSSSLSVGGYVSSSLIPNDMVGNIFSDISQLSKESGRKETICIAFKNTTGDAIEDLTFSFAIEENSPIDIKVAFVQPSLDSCGEPIFEKIPNSSALPLNATFNLVEDNDSYNVGNIVEDGIVGIWFTRSISEFGKQITTCEQLEQQFDDNESTESEKVISMSISWNESDNSNS